MTPGVILVETMAQAGVVAQGIYLLASELAPDALARMLLVFTDANVEFRAVVPPGAAVEVRSRRRFFRRRKLSSEVEMVAEDGSPVCQGVISGMAVAR